MGKGDLLQRIGILLLVLCFVSVLIGVGQLGYRDGQHRREEREQAIRENGQQANRLGVPAEANPYKNSDGSTWLNGWMEEELKKLAKEKHEQ